MKNMISIGYIGYESNEKMKERLLKHPLFENQEIEVISAVDLSELVYYYRSKKVDYLVVPSRNKNDDINVVLIQLISELNTLGLIEIGNIDGSISFNSKKSSIDPLNLDIELCSFDNKYGVHTIYNEDENGESESIEYKIFKRNTYKVRLWDKIQIMLFANNTFRLVINILSVLSTIALFIILILLDNVDDIIEVVMTAFTLMLQLLLGLTKSAESAERKLITGYWIYYSFIDSSTTIGVTPRGFKTRLVEISNEEGELSFKCFFEGEDTLFFSTKQIAFNYDNNTRIGSGFYTYATNISNKQAKRAEGTCRFEGIASDNKPIMMMDGWFFSRGTSLTGTVKFFRVSKEDFLSLQQSIGNASLNNDDNKVVIGVFGPEYSNTDLAYKTYLNHELIQVEHLENKHLIPHYFHSLEEMKRALDSRIIDYAIVPLINRGKLIAKNNLFSNSDKYLPVCDEEMEIKYVLAANDENLVLDNNTIFYGHIESLKQCREFIKDNPTLEVSSSSYGALKLVNEEKKNAVCIINKQAAFEYGLHIVKNNGIEIDPYVEAEVNKTTFVVYKNK